MIQGTTWSELVDLVQLWKSPTAKLPEYLNWQHVFVKIEILPTREENIGKYAIPRCMFGWFGFLTEDNKFSINYLVDTTRLYKQKTSAATRPSQGFEILVLASFRSHYSGVLITYGTATRNCSTEFTFVTELNSFQPVPNDTISDWRTNNVSKIVLPCLLTLKELLAWRHKNRIYMCVCVCVCVKIF